MVGMGHPPRQSGSFAPPVSDGPKSGEEVFKFQGSEGDPNLAEQMLGAPVDLGR
jgi:hypothetical protein